MSKQFYNAEDKFFSGLSGASEQSTYAKTQSKELKRFIKNYLTEINTAEKGAWKDLLKAKAAVAKMEKMTTLTPEQVKLVCKMKDKLEKAIKAYNDDFKI